MNHKDPLRRWGNSWQTFAPLGGPLWEKKFQDSRDHEDLLLLNSAKSVKPLRLERVKPDFLLKSDSATIKPFVWKRIHFGETFYWIFSSKSTLKLEKAPNVSLDFLFLSKVALYSHRETDKTLNK